MPTKRGFCWCLGGHVPPEISYGVDNDGMTLKPMEAALPMPQTEEELNAKFSELVDELGLDKAHREAMFNLPPEKKWQIYCSNKRELKDPQSASWPDYYIERVNAMSSVFYSHDEEEIQNRTKLVDSLKTALRTQPISFVVRFLELNGLNCLLNFLKKMDHTTSQSAIHTCVIGCIKALLNNTQGRASVLADAECINVIAQSLRTNNVKTKVAVLEILGAVCVVPGGHKKVLQAMLLYQQFAKERTRFQNLIIDLDHESGDYKEDVSLKTAIMAFINAALKYGPKQKELEFRLHLRYEFLMLGIQPIIEKLKEHSNATLDKHIDFFEILRAEDEKQLAKKFDMSHIDTRSAGAMFDFLKKKLSLTTAYHNMLSMLFHLLQMPFGNDKAFLQWELVDKVIQQIVLQTKDSDPDVAPLTIDVKKVVQQLANENAIKEIQTKMRDVQKENGELLSELKKKERECEVKIEEAGQLLETLNNMKARLDKEQSSHVETRNDLSAKIQELEQMCERERLERAKLANAVKTGSLPDDAKMDVANYSSYLADANLPTVTPACTPSVPAVAPPPPPPPPPGGGAPPPPGPPPPPGFMPSFPGTALRQKDIPKPSQPLKSFNWAKIPENRVQESIWSHIDDTWLYKTLDLEDFEKTFSAYQRQETLSDFDPNKSVSPRAKILSVIDGRRAQNCTILLSKLKMNNQELSRAILNVDSREEIPKDMCEQLLKFVVTPEETQLLNEHQHEISNMARADRFLYEISRIEHYEERLKALYYKKKFNERINDVKPKVDAVLQASKELLKSKRLKKVLELVLAYGNFMNRGQRGNASGFKISSLNKIADTKSSISRRVTLLHYILEVIEKQFPDLLKMEKDLPHVKEASKVNLSELEADLRTLKVGLVSIEKELEYQRRDNFNTVPEDKFIPVMSSFASVASYNFQELEEQLKEARNNFEKATKMFCEDPKTTQADEFFGVFDMFLVSFIDAQLENEKLRREKEQEEKRVQLEAQLKTEKEKRLNKLSVSGRRSDSIRSIKDEEKGEFDDLISALRTGDVFGEDMANLKRVRRKDNSKSTVPKANTSRERIGNAFKY